MGRLPFFLCSEAFQNNRISGPSAAEHAENLFLLDLGTWSRFPRPRAAWECFIDVKKRDTGTSSVLAASPRVFPRPTHPEFTGRVCLSPVINRRSVGIPFLSGWKEGGIAPSLPSRGRQRFLCCPCFVCAAARPLSGAKQTIGFRDTGLTMSSRRAQIFFLRVSSSAPVPLGERSAPLSFLRPGEFSFFVMAGGLCDGDLPVPPSFADGVVWRLGAGTASL